MDNHDGTNEQTDNESKSRGLTIGAHIVDGTYHKMGDDALHIDKGLYSDLANALPCGIYRLRVFHDVSLNKDRWVSSNDAPYAVEFANDRFYEILHLNRHSYEQKPSVLHDLIFEEDKAEFARMNVESNLHKSTFAWEGRLLINNKVKWVQFRSVPRVMENNDIIWTGTLDDITKRKQIEEELKIKNVELQKLNADKDFFMSMLAHDLKSPFNSILGLLELLIMNLNYYDIDKIRQFILLINDSSVGAYHLLEDILLWAHSQSGKLPFEPGEIDLKHCCKGVIESLKPNADFKNITIRGIETEGINIYADINMLNTILRNLITNAIKFTNRGGIINITAQQNSSDTTIVVSDNGIGISAERIPTLFDISKVHSTKGTDDEKGTGLGILLCKEFVERHGGKIWVESELNKGSLFKFTLPQRSN